MNNYSKGSILLVSSSGGHETQLSHITDYLKQEDLKLFLIKEQMVSEIEKTNKDNIFYLKQFNRKDKMFFKTILQNMFLSFKYIIHIQPSVIITTGAGVVFPVVIIGKILGAKIIYIESFAKRNDLTITGKFIYYTFLSNRFYVQWPELQKKYPKSIFGGTIY